MGKGKAYRCKQCGNIWTHHIGVGFMGVHIEGSKESNSTSDLDDVVKCPKCDNTEFEDLHEDFLWD